MKHFIALYSTESPTCSKSLPRVETGELTINEARLKCITVVNSGILSLEVDEQAQWSYW